MAAAIATTPRQSSISTPASLSSPTFAQHNSPQIPMPHPHRKEVVCVFVVEGTAKMQPYFATLFEAYLEPILRQLRAPIITDGDEKQAKTKVTPILKYGLVVYGDYEPSSTVTVDRKYFTSDFSLFHSVFKNINCSQGGILKNAVYEGLVAALELFDEYKLNAEPTSSDPIFHCILVAASLPYNMSVRCNISEKYDRFGLSNIVEEMRKVCFELHNVNAKSTKLTSPLRTMYKCRWFPRVKGSMSSKGCLPWSTTRRQRLTK
ncbi:hypothetical protein INT44_002400 [Umbelopsis vinacea]|uniref:Mediator of RNA polymerase II transcription subunit 25 n=1 Tax=Umbelopsis vinacea TaxID=44442 RepID=A0A8H7Q3T6_9FUNG|nr:hypothetical protein INT44_002400 [Umbelopsis vinacea]